MLGQGIEAPEWFGKMEISPASGRKEKVIYASEPITGLEFSTAVVLADVLPASECLWVEVKSYGWSDPHCAILEGELFKIDAENLSPIWRITLSEKCAGGGTGSLETAEYSFSHRSNDGGLPTIKTSKKIWAETQQELENPPSKPKSIREQTFVFDGKSFVLKQHP